MSWTVSNMEGGAMSSCQRWVPFLQAACYRANGNIQVQPRHKRRATLHVQNPHCGDEDP